MLTNFERKLWDSGEAPNGRKPMIREG